MHSLKMLVGMTAMVLVATVSSRAGANPETHHLNNAAGMESVQASLPSRMGSNNVRILPEAQELGFVRFVVASTIQDGNDGNKDDDDRDREDHHHPRSRSVHCPDKDDHHNISYLADDDHKSDKDQDRDKDKDKDRDRDHRDRCGKGDDDRNP